MLDLAAYLARLGIESSSPAAPPSAANHLALTVHGLPAPECPSGDWLVDAGLGDAMHRPLPLREGTYTQGPFTYRLRRSAVEPGGWRFDHDARCSFVGMDFRAERATQADFSARHEHLSTSPDSPFVRTSTVQRRDAGGVDSLTGCVLHRLDGKGRTSRTLERAHDWYDALATVFGLPLRDLAARERAALWARVRRTHEAWRAA